MWLEGHLQRVIWASEESGWAVIRVQTKYEAVTAVGTLAGAIEDGEGVFVALEGNWQAHPTHGKQFKAEGYLQGGPQTENGIALYLASNGVKGVGNKVAEAIVSRFGMHTPHIIATEPHRLTEVPGVGAARAKAISDQWQRDESGRALTMTLRGLGLSPRLVERIRKRYGARAGEVVRTDPYLLAEEIRGVGFIRADQLARRQGLPLDHPARVRAAVAHVLREAEQDGHCFLTRERCRGALTQLSVPVEGLDQAVQDAEAAGTVVVEAEDHAEQDRLWGARLFTAEQQVARDLIERSQVEQGAIADEALLSAAERYEGVTLDPTQRDAVLAALKGGLVVITGGPGTGKTTLVRVLLRVVRELDMRWRLAAPTGRAARRLADATGQEASTIHRLLEFNPGEGGFTRNLMNPIEGSGLVVDEVSMVDIELMRSLLDALPWPAEQFHLVLVGDADQLPSVGPGQVLDDILASQQVRSVRLQTVHRQAADSGIITAANEVLAGSVPVSGERSGRADVFLIRRDDGLAAQQTLLKVVSERLVAKGFDAIADVQVLAPTRRGALGTQALNKALQQRLNPDGRALKQGEREWRQGDRVICIKNRYDVEVFNGDVGQITAVSKGLVIDFDGKRVPWAREELNMLDLAYAITVHKSQGSEYPAVVMALHGSHGLMLRRRLFYTGLTRASRFLCIIGSPKAWNRAVRDHGGDQRATRLRQRLQEGP